MINLLPQSYKEKIDETRKFKAAAMLAIISVTVSVSFALMLVLVQNFYWGKLKVAEAEAAGKEFEAKIYEVENSKKEISKSNLTIAGLKKMHSGRTHVGEIFNLIAQSIPEGVAFDRFSFVLGKIGLSGHAATRQDLAKFKSNLEAQKNFKNIFFPPESWINEKNIEFAVTFDYVIKK